jgi:hypothetical protein
MKSKTKKGQMNISFGWIFAIIVGGIILALTIYGVTKFTGIQGVQRSAETSRSIDVLLNPLESGFETGQKVLISNSAETRIYLQCDLQGSLGRQRIQTIQKSFNTWSEAGPILTSLNKYIFSERVIEGRNFVAFSKPFEFPSENTYEFPFKVADLIYLVPESKNYCFIDAPTNIEREITDLKIDNFIFGECPSNSIKICFSNSGDCDVKVNYNSGIVERDSNISYFETDSLMYAAIFADNENYECQVKRVMKRAEQISLIYIEKSRIENEAGCRGNLENELILFNNILKNFESSRDLKIVGEEAKRINKLNSLEGDCKLW